MTTDTSVEFALKEIKRGILLGEFKPGDRLNIEKLKRNHDVGLTPLREALNRLLGLGFVEFTPLKGFRVTHLSEVDLIDLYDVRQHIETKALDLSIQQGDDAWEGRILAAFHRLSKLEAVMSVAPDQVIEWLARYHDFHFALLSACRSPWLLTLDQQLFSQSERYRCLVLLKATDSKKKLAEKKESHQSLIDAVLSRKRKIALDIFSEQLQSTVKDLLKYFKKNN